MSRKEYSFIEVCDIQGGTQPPKDEFVYEKKDGYIRLLQIQDFKREDKTVYIKDRHTLKKYFRPPHPQVPLQWQRPQTP